MLSAHKDEDRIVAIRGMSQKERVKAIDTLRKEGIYKKNKELIAKGTESSDLIPERRSEGLKVFCSHCKGTFNKSYFHRHKKTCSSPGKPHGKPVKYMKENQPPDSKFYGILENMERDRYFDIIQSDAEIKLVGKHIFDCVKPAKERDAIMKSRTAMRRLARLVECTENVSRGLELFHVKNFYSLEEALREVCKVDSSSTTNASPSSVGTIKSGLKVALGALLRKAAKVLVADCLIRNDKEEAREIEEFTKVLDMNYAKIFSQAEYNLKEKRQRENRKPGGLPDEKNLQTLRTYLIEETKKTVECVESQSGSITASQFVHLRKLALTRVTLVNGRRGSEVARMLLQDFKDKDSWISKKDLTPSEEELVKKYGLAFIMGKGNTLVPVLIPRDAIKPLEILADPKIREQAGVNADNSFLFSYTQESDFNSIGFNEIRDVCKSIGLPVITATSVRHRASTIFWRLDGIEASTVDAYMGHMGHHKDISKNIYAVPPALNTLKQVAPLIDQMDQVPE